MDGIIYSDEFIRTYVNGIIQYAVGKIRTDNDGVSSWDHSDRIYQTDLSGETSRTDKGYEIQFAPKKRSEDTPLIDRDDSVSIGRESLDSGHYSIDQNEKGDSKSPLSASDRLKRKNEMRSEITIDLNKDKKSTETKDGQIGGDKTVEIQMNTGNLSSSELEGKSTRPVAANDVVIAVGERKEDEKGDGAKSSIEMNEQNQDQMTDDQAKLTAPQATGKKIEKTPLIKKGKKDKKDKNKESKIRDVGPGCLCCTIL